jgi:Sulfotransferase domain
MLLHHRSLVCSIPKSGTYLLNDILQKLGSCDTHWHISRDEYCAYQFGSLDEYRADPEKFRVLASFRDTLSRVARGEHAVSHLAPDEDVVSACALLKFKVFFAYRDLRDCAVSYMRFLAATGRDSTAESSWIQAEDGPDRFSRFLETYSWFFRQAMPITLWRDQPFALSVQYERLVGDYGTDAQHDALAAICRHLDLQPSTPDLERTLRQSLKSATLTSSGYRSDRRNYWSDAVQQRFTDFGGAELNRILGYLSE